jgi:hypothetical protein
MPTKSPTTVGLCVFLDKLLDDIKRIN